MGITTVFFFIMAAATGLFPVRARGGVDDLKAVSSPAVQTNGESASLSQTDAGISDERTASLIPSKTDDAHAEEAGAGTTDDQNGAAVDASMDAEPQTIQPSVETGPETAGRPSTTGEPERDAAPEMVVKAVDIKGNRIIATSQILRVIKTRAGEPYRQTVVSDDLKRLYSTGYFADVSVDRESYEDGVKVVFYVKEKPIVKAITFSRLRHYKPKALLRRMKTKVEGFFDNKNLKDDIETIKDMYHKKGLTLVSVRVDKKWDEDDNTVSLHFIINEGYRVRVRRIRFEGNEHFPYRRLIKVIKTRPAWLFNRGYLKEDVLKDDIKRLRSFYETEGFIDAKVDYRFESYRKGLIDVIISIEEGKRYEVESVEIDGNTVFSDETLLAAMKAIKPGGVFSRKRLQEDVARIRSRYFDRGYIYAKVDEDAFLDPETGKVRVRLSIKEGEVAYVNRIIIQGNERTRDTVIRRELLLYPGDRFDGEKLKRSKQKLIGLGYFEEVNYDIQDTDDARRKDLIVRVKEAKTGSFSFGGGYSTVDQVVGFVEIEQRNFDITNWRTFTGGGQQLLLRLETGSTRQNTRISFTEPWLFDYPISFGFDGYLTKRERERNVGYAFDESRKGGDVRLGKRFTPEFSSTLTYRLEKVEIDNFDEGVSADLLAEAGENWVSTVTNNVVYDKRDNPFNPQKGWLYNATTDVAGGILGGDKNFVRFLQRVSVYHPMPWGSVIELRLRTGVADAYGKTDKVPIFERFYAGGANTIRGYEERRVGPLDAVTEDPIGGEALVVGNIEWTVPLIDVLKLALFYDVGNVWGRLSDFGGGGYKSGAGMGLRIKTPIGPISLDYGYPLNDEPGEEKRSGKFYFSVSRGF